MFQKKLEEITAKTDAEKEWWEKRRAAISSDFMKELDEDGEKSQATAPSDDGILVDVSSPGEASKKKKKGKK
jgi:translocation protein SEC66